VIGGFGITLDLFQTPVTDITTLLLPKTKWLTVSFF
jgi:hypothetical protein